ncbi:MAG: uroporphyrinogen decarboxylase family protein, partial [Bacteroidota bacterium]|nr:uroporphyrinogen decarboxylase family protein [Bacteroidota bacterium]
NKVTMLGNIPPRDVLAAGSEEDVEKALQTLIDGMKDKSKIILSCGGGMPPMVNTANIKRFISVADKASGI